MLSNGESRVENGNLAYRQQQVCDSRRPKPGLLYVKVIGAERQGQEAVLAAMVGVDGPPQSPFLVGEGHQYTRNGCAARIVNGSVQFRKSSALPRKHATEENQSTGMDR